MGLAEFSLAALLGSIVPEVGLGWEAPEGCRPAADVRAQIEAANLELDEPVEGQVVVQGEAGAWSAEVSIDVEGSIVRRTLGESDCDALADAIAVVVLVTLDPLAREEDAALVPAPEPAVQKVEPDPPEAPGDPEPTASEEPEPTAVPSETPESSPESVPARRRVRWEGVALWLGGGGEIGMLQVLFGTAAAGVGLRFGPLRVDASGVFVGVRRIEHEGGGAAVFNVGGAQLRACGVPAWGRFELPLCGGAEAGAIAARGRGLTRTRTVRTPWANALASVRAQGNVAGRWWIWGGLEGAISLVRPGFAIDDFEEPIADVSAGSLRFVAGVEVRFP